MRNTSFTVPADMPLTNRLDKMTTEQAKWCKGIKPPSPAQSEILGLLRDGKVWKTSEIVAHSRFARQNIMTALKKLLDAGTICKIKRGQYQKITLSCKNGRKK